MEAREVADEMTDPEAKLVMLGIAQLYETLAEASPQARAEERPRD